MKATQRKGQVVYDLTIYTHNNEEATIGSYGSLEDAEEQLKAVLEWVKENPDGDKLTMVLDKTTMRIETEVLKVV